MTSRASPSWKSSLPEIALIFAVFFLQGAWPVPDVNEPYYLGKAIRYWNPDWVRGDFFLETADTHTVFYVTFGWLSLWLSPAALAWTGRIAQWWLMAWAWRRLSFAIVPRPWLALLSAALFAGAVDRYHMAGEWVFGGVEAKGFAFVLVFLGLEALVRERCSRMWIFFGAASAFHVLVGGWACVAAGAAWLGSAASRRPTLRSMLPGLLGGFALALLSLWPSLTLNAGASPDVLRRAHEIYVYRRLSHHLVLSGMKWEFIARFVALSAVWALLAWPTAGEAPARRIRAFVWGSLAIALVGAVLSLAAWWDPVWAAPWLRYYWFRLSDVAAPMGIALAGAALAARWLASRPTLGRAWVSALAGAALLHVGCYAHLRMQPATPRADAKVQHTAWVDICEKVNASPAIPRHARFITPFNAQTFSWHTGRSQVATRKDIPQDAASIVAWWDRLQDVYGTGDPDSPWFASLAERSPETLRALGRRYQADFLLTETTLPVELPLVLKNDAYAVYRLDDGAGR